MSFLSKRRERKFEKKKEKVRRELSLHLFAVTAAEQNSPSHKKLKENPSQEDIDSFLDYRMRLRRKWIDTFFQFHPDVDSKIKEEVIKEAEKDIEAFEASLLANLE